MTRAAGFVLLLTGVLVACGDNTTPVGPPLEPADSLFVIAHFDDDMIFMEPELLAAIAAGSLTTVYVTSGDPHHGDDHAETVFEDARRAYSAITGSSSWECGYLEVADAPIHHCRLADRRISLIGLDLPDGGIDADTATTLLQLVQGDVPSVKIFGPAGGRATVDSVTATLAQIIEVTAPDHIHALDLSATHGRDHSSHMFSSSFALWGAARVGYAGAIRWHRGYNVATEPATLSDADYLAAEHMLGYFDACYEGCGPCGTSCPTLDTSHEGWLRRQYSTARAQPTVGALVADASGGCVSVTATGAAALGDCAAASTVILSATGELTAGGACATGAELGAITFIPCTAGDPAQYWVLDDQGFLWNGRPPVASPDMAYDHVRCLNADLSTPTCGASLQPHWHIAVR